METLICRILPYEVAEGPFNMAADEALLASALAGTPSLRFYGWSTATLSLGYFQPEKTRLADVRLAALPFVRRPSGGAALVHDRELTYAFALPCKTPWLHQNTRPAAWLARMHRIIASGLAFLGAQIEIVEQFRESNSLSSLCFKKLTSGDLLVGNDKIVGSAQRRLHGALLQHGAILLQRSWHAPCLPGVFELTGKRLAEQDVRSAICLAWADETGSQLIEDPWTVGERQRIHELLQSRYQQSHWNCKR